MTRNYMTAIPNPMGNATSAMSAAGNTTANMMREQKTETTAPGKTIGGAIGSATGMGMAGYMMAGASKGSMGGVTGLAIGAGLGALSYFLS
jgi:hypothetical protein